MKNKETLEQASEKYANMHQDVSGKLGKYLVKSVFQDGANCQAKKMYSEEEVESLLQRFRSYSYNHGCGNAEFKEWFNEFKKK